MHTDPPTVLRDLLMAVVDDMDEFATSYLDELRTIPGYAAVSIPAADLTTTTRDALELIVRRVAGIPLSHRHDVVSESLGRRRAAQGVPLDVLLQAVRMTFRLLWTSLERRATAEQREALHASAVDLWEAIEFHTVRVHAGYLQEASRMRRDRLVERAALLTRFLDGPRRDPSLVDVVATELHVDPAGSFTVVAAPLPAERAIAALVDGATRLAARNDALLVLVPTVRGRAPDWLDACDAPLGVAPLVTGLDRVPSAWRVARDLLMAAPVRAVGPHTLTADWPSLVAARLPELTADVVAAVDRGFGEVSAQTRARLLETVRRYLESGSLAETAEALHCHRNTVLKRLARFTELTGLVPSRPWDAATVRLLIAAENA